MFGPKIEIQTEGWRKFHNEELGYLFSLYTFRVSKSGRKIRAVYVGKKNAYRILVIKL
jgi:hypothetical protein